MKLCHLFESFDYNSFDDLPLEEKLKYAKSKLLRLGQGQFRMVYITKDKKAIKIAKLDKGVESNKTEIEILNDKYIQSLDMTIPLVKYHENYHYLITEIAKPLKKEQFDEYFISDFTIIDILADTSNIEYDLTEYPYLQQLVKFFDYAHRKYNITFGDLAKISNWGLYNNKPVLLDIGMTY